MFPIFARRAPDNDNRLVRTLCGIADNLVGKRHFVKMERPMPPKSFVRHVFDRPVGIDFFQRFVDFHAFVFQPFDKVYFIRRLDVPARAVSDVKPIVLHPAENRNDVAFGQRQRAVVFKHYDAFFRDSPCKVFHFVGYVLVSFNLPAGRLRERHDFVQYLCSDAHFVSFSI